MKGQKEGKTRAAPTINFGKKKREALYLQSLGKGEGKRNWGFEKKASHPTKMRRGRKEGGSTGKKKKKKGWSAGRGRKRNFPPKRKERKATLMKKGGKKKGWENVSSKEGGQRKKMSPS